MSSFGKQNVAVVTVLFGVKEYLFYFKLMNSQLIFIFKMKLPLALLRVSINWAFVK